MPLQRSVSTCLANQATTECTLARCNHLPFFSEGGQEFQLLRCDLIWMATVKSGWILPGSSENGEQEYISPLGVNKKPVSRQGCDEMKVILKTSTEITESPRGMDASMLISPQPEVSVITLSKLGLTDNYQKMITEVKVLSMMEWIWASGGKKKRDVTIGDK